MKKKNIFALLLLSVTLFYSCKSYEDIAYMQGLEEGDVVQLTKKIASTINTNDVLLITVSATNPEAVAVFSPPIANPAALGSRDISTTPTMQNYQVDPDSCINFPILGRIKVAGFTRTELEQYLQKEIAAFVTDPIVKVNIQTNRITVLGEVTSPGIYGIANERMTLFEALGAAKDLTIYGRRDNILVTRQLGEDEIATIRVDLTKPDVFNSPGFYLQKGDVIYVEPNKHRKTNSSYNSNKQYNLSMISTIISGVSVIASLVAILVNNSTSGN